MTITSPQPVAASQYGTFERTARFVGDLDHDLYSDPVQGSAWNEASAVGFQLTLIGGLIGSGLMHLLGGDAGSMYGAIVLGFIGIVSIAVAIYAQAKGVVIRVSRQDVFRPRSLIIAAALAIHAAALVRHDAIEPMTTLGFVSGFGVVCGVFVGLSLAARRSTTK